MWCAPYDLWTFTRIVLWTQFSGSKRLNKFIPIFPFYSNLFVFNKRQNGWTECCGNLYDLRAQGRFIEGEIWKIVPGKICLAAFIIFENERENLRMMQRLIEQWWKANITLTEIGARAKLSKRIVLKIGLTTKNMGTYSKYKNAPKMPIMYSVHV